MYIAIMDNVNRSNLLDKQTTILGLYRERENAKVVIRNLTNMMLEQCPFMWKDEAQSGGSMTILKSNTFELRYWILEEEVFEDAC